MFSEISCLYFFWSGLATLRDKIISYFIYVGSYSNIYIFFVLLLDDSKKLPISACVCFYFLFSTDSLSFLHMHIFEGKSYVVFCFENLDGYDVIKL